MCPMCLSNLCNIKSTVQRFKIAVNYKKHFGQIASRGHLGVKITTWLATFIVKFEFIRSLLFCSRPHTNLALECIAYIYGIKLER